MTGYYVLIETDTKEVNAVIQQLQDRLSPIGLVTYLNTVVDPFVRERIDQRFGSEGDDVSGAWHPLEQATQQIRAAYGFPPDHPINVRTGKLHSFLVGTPSDVKPDGMGATLEHPPPIADPIIRKKLDTVQAGSASPKTPARPVIGLNQNDLLFITSSLVAYLVEGMTP